MGEADGRNLITVIVAVRNAATTLERTLESILAQSYRDIEIVLIDGASTDGTQEIVSRYASRLAFSVSEPDNGIADAYNKGIRHSSGKWVYFLNADDVFFNNDVLSSVFSRDPYDGYEVLIGKVIADTGRLFDGRLSWRLLMRNQVHHQAVLYRGTFLREHVYNDQYRRYGHDHEHNLMLWKKRVKAQYLPQVLARWNSGGVSDAAKWKDYKEEFKLRRNVVGRAAWIWNGFTVARFLMKQSRRKGNRIKALAAGRQKRGA